LGKKCLVLILGDLKKLESKLFSPIKPRLFEDSSQVRIYYYLMPGSVAGKQNLDCKDLYPILDFTFNRII
jgi:hypothetical protein